jgi:hypothetical protein
VLRRADLVDLRPCGRKKQPPLPQKPNDEKKKVAAPRLDFERLCQGKLPTGDGVEPPDGTETVAGSVNTATLF